MLEGWESKGKNALGKLGSKSKNVWEIREGSKKDKNQEGRREIRKKKPTIRVTFTVRKIVFLFYLLSIFRWKSRISP